MKKYIDWLASRKIDFARVAGAGAISLARHTSQKVLLLEGDLRQPELASTFGLPSLRGLGECSELIGAEAYYSATLPPCVPLWRFQRID